MSVTSLAVFLLVAMVAYAFVTPETDPLPWGTGPCITDADCGGTIAGVCEAWGGNTTLSCHCRITRGNPNCDYERFDREYIGGMQFLCFIGVGGVGNLICHRNGPGIGQVILMASGYMMCVLACCACIAGGIGGLVGGEKGAMAAGGVMTILLSFAGIILGCAAFAGWVWSLVDASAFLHGNLADGNGYAMY